MAGDRLLSDKFKNRLASLYGKLCVAREQIQTPIVFPYMVGNRLLGKIFPFRSLSLYGN